MKKKEQKILKNIPTFIVDINKIKVKKRIRKDTGDLKELKESLTKYGQMNPIIVDSKYNLIAGERRYIALKSMGSKEIEVKVIKNIDDMDRLALEVEENSTRKDFSSSEYREAINRKKLLELKKKSYFAYLFESFLNFIKALMGKKNN